MASQSVQAAPEPAPPPQSAALEQFRALKHQPEQCAFCIMPGGSARGLLAECKGRITHTSTRDSQ
eukprot:8394524-Pyramimonas_sp.AAC.1